MLGPPPFCSLCWECSGEVDEHMLCLAANVPEEAMLAYLRGTRKTRYIYD